MIRKANNSDIAIILKLLSEVLEIHANIRPDIFIKGTTKYNHTDLEVMLDDENRPIYVITDNDIVVGYAMCAFMIRNKTNNQYGSKALFIDDFCIEENARNKGFGKVLFNYLIELAKEEGFDEIVLNVWAGNDAAIAFYEKMGLKVKKQEMELKIK